MTSPAPLTAAWLEEQLRHALEQVDWLAREVLRLERLLAAREHDANELRATMATIEQSLQGRHASDARLRELTQAVAELDTRLTDEASLRREQSAMLGRMQTRGREAEGSVERVVVELQDRLAEVERALVAVRVRQAGTITGTAAQDARGAELSLQVEELRAQLASVVGGSLHDSAAEVAADQSVVVEEALRTLGIQHRDLLREQHRLVGEVSALQHSVEREDSLSDLGDQLRTLRQRLESGLATIEARVASVDDSQVIEAEERRLLRVRIETLERRLDALSGQLDSERVVLLQHVGRATETAEAAGRRQAEEIARQARVARELLVRLRETADEAAREQPL
jgi:hypothetical protein